MPAASRRRASAGTGRPVATEVCWLYTLLQIELLATASRVTAELSFRAAYGLAGLVVKASASGAEDPGFQSHFPGRVIPVT